MPELSDAETSSAMAEDSRSALQAWRAVIGWANIILQVVIQFLRFSPSSWAQLLSFVGLRHHPHALLSSSASFMPLPADIPAEVLIAAPSSVPSSGPSEELEKLTIVLDLDETLVCAYEASSLPEVVRSQAIEAGLKYFELHCKTIDKEAEGGESVNHIVVFVRPGLEEFLEQISTFADLVLFTAGLEGYASPLVDVIDANNRFSLRLYRPATVTTEYRQHVKDLSCLSKDLCRVIIVDNNPFSFLLQPLNGIPCFPFSAAQPHDEQLLKVVLPLLKLLSLEKDVRPALHRKFCMPEWFEKHGISFL
ncbi:Mitochondrial import inner membrane translocase subunit TIM50 [Platanthera zijinensis]|uniref:Mitochondrial import inner membrane translocase subunit TIM50 n=1 Tax=Platanthera zijinensis TaxID=2320716 RepID=A0AAP0B2X0_9ASPA